MQLFYSAGPQQQPRDWLGRASLKWHISYWVGYETLAESTTLLGVFCRGRSLDLVPPIFSFKYNKNISRMIIEMRDIQCQNWFIIRHNLRSDYPTMMMESMFSINFYFSFPSCWHEDNSQSCIVKFLIWVQLRWARKLESLIWNYFTKVNRQANQNVALLLLKLERCVIHHSWVKKLVWAKCAISLTAELLLLINALK